VTVILTAPLIYMLIEKLKPFIAAEKEVESPWRAAENE
jgi:hypothetical protein